jgi:alkylation response protein AidB-like acyl-CoA dehydrogenase
MDFSFTEEQQQLQQTVRGFLESYCTKEWLDDLEEKQEYPFELFRRLADLGCFGIGVPESQGGYGGGMVEVAILAEEMGRFGGSIGMTWMPTAVFGNQTLTGDDALRERFTPLIVAGELRTAFALTEPEAGSDAAAIRTRAERRGDEWILDGAKIFSTGAHVADYLIVTARIGDVGDRHRGITVFMVDAQSEGLTVTGIPKLGHNAVKTCEVGLAEVRVPEDMVVGEVGAGWKALGNVLDAERIATAALCVGLAQRCTDMALEYGLQREQFGRPIATFQALSHLLAEMETETAAARWLTFDSAWRKDAGLPCSKAASMAKSYATECGTRTATRGMQVLGGYSYTKEYEMERFYREAKLYEVAGGATQIQRNIIAKQMGIPDS